MINGWSPLHLALRRGNLAQTKLLVRNGADKDKVSENHEAQKPADIIKAKGFILNLNTPVPHFTFSTDKELLLLFKGPDKDHHRKITTDSKHNLFHPDLLKRYSEVKEFTAFNRMLEFMKVLPSGHAINIMLDVHGTLDHDDYKLLILNEYTLFSFAYNHSYSSKDLLKGIINASNNKPLKLFSTACFGQNLHTCNNKLGQEMPKDSVIITLSNKDRVTDMLDGCHPDMYKILDTLLLGNKGSCLKLEDLLEAHCLSQRFMKNTPTISAFDGKTQKIITLNDYFNSKLLDQEEVSISHKLESLLNIKGLSKEDLASIAKELQHSENNIAQNSLFKMPKSISDIKVLFEAVENKKLDELFKLYSYYYTEGSLDKVFSPETFNLDSYLKREYTYYQECVFNDQNYKDFTKHCTPLIFEGTNFQRYMQNAKIYENDLVTHAILKHSLLLAWAADHLIVELNSMANSAVEVSGEHIEDNF